MASFMRRHLTDDRCGGSDVNVIKMQWPLATLQKLSVDADAELIWAPVSRCTT